MLALHLRKPGANPALQCALEGPLFDPLVYAAAETVRDTRSLSAATQVTADLDFGLFNHEGREFNTLSEILCQRLRKVGFQVARGAFVLDRFCRFNLLQCSFPELLFRLQWTWVSVLPRMVQHRQTYYCLQHVDVLATRAAYSWFDSFDQGVLRKHMHGASITNAHAQHLSEDSCGSCLLCGFDDSTRHRLWQCPGTADLRAQLLNAFLVECQGLPSVVMEQGWTLALTLTDSWYQYLASVLPDVVFQPGPSCGPIVDLFTDGSCMNPTEPALRFAAFAVVLSKPFQLDFNSSWFYPVAAQPLSGVLQTAYRAELRAVIVALQFARRHRVCARIWTDCLNVLHAFQTHVVNGLRIQPNGRNADLLCELVDCAEQLGLANVAVLKVPAHEDRSSYLTLNGGWSMAIKPARPVRLGRVQPTLVRDQPHGLALCRSVFQRSFGLDLASDVHSWITCVRDPLQPLRWVSFLHLYISFQHRVGPVIQKSRGTWVSDKGDVARLANHVRLNVRIKYFRLMVQQYFRDAKVHL